MYMHFKRRFLCVYGFLDADSQYKLAFKMMSKVVWLSKVVNIDGNLSILPQFGIASDKELYI